MYKKILVTGASGFIGRATVKSLLREGMDVIALVRTSCSIETMLSLSVNLRVYALDKMSLDEVFATEKNIDCVLHTATCHLRKSSDVIDIVQANLNFSLDLLSKTVQYSIGSFINLDTYLPDYYNFYSLSKHQFSEWSKSISERKKIKVINLVLHIVYGSDVESKSFLSSIIVSLLENQPKLPLTKGEQYRDFIHINDVTSAISLVISKISSISQCFSSFEVGSSSPIEIRSLVEQIKELIKSDTELLFGEMPYHPMEVMYTKSNNAALNALGWFPHVNFQDGIIQMINEFRKRRAKYMENS